MPINKYTLIAFLLLALATFLPACKPDESGDAAAQDRHRAAMKDWGKVRAVQFCPTNGRDRAKRVLTWVEAA